APLEPEDLEPLVREMRARQRHFQVVARHAICSALTGLTSSSLVRRGPRSQLGPGGWFLGTVSNPRYIFGTFFTASPVVKYTNEASTAMPPTLPWLVARIVGMTCGRLRGPFATDPPSLIVVQ